MPSAAERGIMVRQRLLRAAAEMIPEHGWTAVSTRMVAERAEVAPGLVHYHFSSVQALLREAALGTIRAVMGQFTALLAGVDNPSEAIDVLFGALAEFSGDDPVSLLFCEASLAAGRDEQLRAALAELIGEVRDTLAGWLGAHGVPDEKATAAMLTAAIDGIAIHRTLGIAIPLPDTVRVLRRLVADRRPAKDRPTKDHRKDGAST